MLCTWYTWLCIYRNSCIDERLPIYVLCIYCTRCIDERLPIYTA